MPLIPPNPINANTYLPGTQVIPGFLLITAITQAYPMVVSITNSPGNTYIPGQVVRLNIPPAYGMQQANGLQASIMSINGTDFSLNINSSLFDTFAVPAPSIYTIEPATLSPAGSSNLQYSNSSSQVAFQNLNNQGN